jgi:Carboxypeptidase regulatory-like domain
MRMPFSIRAVGPVVLFWILRSAIVGAQIDGGNIVGRSEDQTGGVLPGASVTVTGTETGLGRSTVTDEGGNYGFFTLPVGTYRIRVSLADFGTQERTFVLAVGQTLTVDFILHPAGVEETMVVRAESPLIQTRSSQVHGVIEVEQIENLPINGRDFQTLATLVPGVTSGNTAVNQNYDPVKKFVPAISINGQNGRNINMSIDGGDNNDFSMGGQKITLSQAAVQEFEVITQRHRAEYGKGAGGVINVITRRGANTWSGSGFGFFRGDELQSIDAISDSLGADKPPFDSQQVGGTVGGPLIRDTAFFFYSYERQSRDTSSVFNSGGAFPTQDGDVVPQPFRQNMNTARFDLNAPRSIRLFARYSGQDFTVERELFSPTTAPESTNSEENDFHDVVVGITSVVGDNAVNDFRFHYAWFRNRILNDLSNDEFPTLIFPAGSFGASEAGDQSTKEVAWEFRNDFTFQKGDHQIKVGGTALLRPTIVLDGNLRRNRFTFANNDFDPETRTIGPTNEALFLRTWSAPRFDIFNRELSEFGVYIQDDFRVDARTTLNVGARYDFIHNLFYERDVAASQFVYDQLGRRPRDDKNNLAGRVGVAFDVLGDGHTVIRGGYGRYYDPAAVMAATLFEELDRRDLEQPPYQFTFIPAELFDALGIVAGEPVPETAIRKALDLGLVVPFNFVNGPDLRVASADQLNAGIAHQLTSGSLAGLALDASVVYSRTTGLNAVLLTPEFPALGPTVQLNDSTGKSEYWGLLFSARKRFYAWQVYGSYTLSTAEESTNQFSYNPLDFSDPNGQGEFGPTNFDERHRLVVSGMVALPGDFRLSGVVLAAAARPWTPGCDCDVNGDGQIASNGPSGSRTFNSFNGDRVGPRGSRRGDPTYSVDVRVSKQVRLGGDARLEMMFEVFNLFDAANFGQNTFDNGDDPQRFGTPINIMTPPRTAQIGVRLQF